MIVFSVARSQQSHTGIAQNAIIPISLQ